jgi:hypothetical protein
MSDREFKPGEGSRPIDCVNPSPGFSLALETTLSRKGRGCSDVSRFLHCFTPTTVIAGLDPAIKESLCEDDGWPGQARP